MSADCVIGTKIEVPRSTYMREDQPDRVSEGNIVQVNTLDQHADVFRPAIAEFQAPRSSCGAFACAHAVLISARLAAGDSASEILEGLKDVDAVHHEVRNFMSFAQKSRLAYIQEHPEGFPSKRDEAKYMSAWYANYELSDYCIQEAARIGEAVRFLRYNQWPERGDATHEEAERLVEEERFGGQTQGDKSTVALEAGASRFIVERFAPARSLETPEQWLQERGAGCNTGVFILDVNGHFVTAFAASAEEPELIVVNTTGSSYLSAGAPAAAFDLAYPAPQPE